MPSYRYVIRYIHDNSIRAEVDLYDVQYGYAMNGYGAMSARCAMTPSLQSPAADPLELTQPQRHMLCIERNTQLVWAGPIWTRSCDFDKGEISIGGNEWGSVLSRVALSNDLDYYDTQTQVVVDQLLSPITTLLPLPSPFRQGSGGGLDNLIEGIFTSAEHPTLAEALDRLATSPLNGFEYRWKSEYGTGNFLYNYLVVGSPLGVVLPVPLDHMAKGNGGTIDSYAREEHDTPMVVRGYTSDGYRIQTVAISYPDLPVAQPFAGSVAYNFGDYTDDEISDILSHRADLLFANTASAAGFRPFATHKVGIVAPVTLDAYGNVGDRMTLHIQDRLTKATSIYTGRMLDKNVSYSADGVEKLALTVGAA